MFDMQGDIFVSVTTYGNEIDLISASLGALRPTMTTTRIALGIEYHGSPYCGWQSQLSGCAVQNHLERALQLFLGVEVSVVCAGRTDTGVHGLAQVVHLDTNIERDERSWVRGTNTHLPSTIRVLWAKKVSDDFHARFSARSRTYHYMLLNDPTASAILTGLVGWFHAPLALGPMQQAALLLAGEHDFSAFRAAECQAKSPVKTLYEVNVSSASSPISAEQSFIKFSFRGNAFLHHMVRNIVGSLVYVGAGRQSIEAFQTIFESRDRTRAAPTFAPDGLYLTAIEYDASFGLPAVSARIPFFN